MYNQQRYKNQSIIWICLWYIIKIAIHFYLFWNIWELLSKQWQEKIEATVSRPWALTRWPVVHGLERGHGAMGGVLSPLAAWNRYLSPLPVQLLWRILHLPSLPQVEMLSTAYLFHIDSYPTRPLLFIIKKFLFWLLYKLLGLFYQLKGTMFLICI